MPGILQTKWRRAKGRSQTVAMKVPCLTACMHAAQRKNTRQLQQLVLYKVIITLHS